VVELIRVRAGDLEANPANWRRHPERQRAALQELLRDIGYADALLARREGGGLVLVDGHLRQSLDPDQVVPVLVLDVSEEEADTLLATVDPLAALARPDPEALAALLERVRSSDQAVRDLLERVAREGGVAMSRPLRGDPEEVPALPHTPRTRPGDLWVLGPHRLLCGDTRDPAQVGRLMAGERAAVLWTDPPYGVSYVGRTRNALRIAGDTARGLRALLEESFGAASAHLADGARIYLCHPAGPLQVEFLGAFGAQGWRLHQTIVWVKDAMVLGHADYHYRHEPIAYGYAPGSGRWGRGAQGWYGGNTCDSVLEVPRPTASPDHPTAKPVELIRRCLHNSSARGDVVLDPFAGSGSTLVACQVLGRRGMGMEIDPRYCDVVVGRFQALTGEEATLEPGPGP
jgi:DNA modification methylase